MILNGITMEGLEEQNTNISIGDNGASCHMDVSLEGMIYLENIDEAITVGDIQSTKAKNIVKNKGIIKLENGQNQDIF